MDINQFFESEEASFFNGYLATDGKWYCLDCFCREVLKSDPARIEQFSENILADNILATPELQDTINEHTVQYEQSPGESIPLEGIECCNCGVELKRHKQVRSS